LEQTIVIAGANGFMGNRCVAEALLKHKKVIALARAGEGESAEERVYAELAENIESFLLEPLQSNLTVYAYNILDKNLGLPDAVVEEINKTADAVINFVGDTNFFPKDNEKAREINIKGALNIIETMCRGKAVFNHVSTAYVCGARDGVIKESELNVGQAFKNNYEETKCEAEQAIIDLCNKKKVLYNIFRPSIVIRRHSQHGKIPNLNHFYSFIGLLDILRQDAQTQAHTDLKERLQVSVRFPGRKNSTLNFVDLDYSVQAILWIALRKKENKVYHLVQPNPLTNQEFLDVMMQLYHLEGLSILENMEDFKKPNFYERLIKRALSNYIDYFFVNPRFDDSNTRQALDGSNIECPPFDLLYLAHATGHPSVKNQE
jgi:nucleoside-diphosphate-sugar epimerase